MGKKMEFNVKSEEISKIMKDFVFNIQIKIYDNKFC